MNSYDSYFYELQKKYNYSEEIIKALKKIIPAMIDYFGYENINKILFLISKTQIHIKQNNEDPNEYISNYFGVKDKYITNDIVDGYATMRPIKDGQMYVGKSIIYLFNNDLSVHSANFSVLLHELCHIVKMSHFNNVNNKYLEKRTGFQEEKYDFNGNLLERKNYAWEETTTAHDETEIMKIITNDYNYISQGSEYDIAARFFNMFLNVVPGIYKEILNDEIKGTKYLQSFLNTPKGNFFGEFEILFNRCFNLANIESKEVLYNEYDKIEKDFIKLLDKLNFVLNNYSFGNHSKK